MKLLFSIGALICLNILTSAQLPKVSAGKIERFENVKSKFITSRSVDVWLPEGYTKSKKYPVLYMHDGQMLFDSSITWNHSSWDVDDVLNKMLAQGLIKEVIVVGVWNGGATRHADYFPQKPFTKITESQNQLISKQLKASGRTIDTFKPVSDNYLKFLVQELKPFIDSVFSTKNDRRNTYIAGSSMGGLISIYAICEYPNVFGGAACISTHWPGIFTMENNPIPSAFIDYLKLHLPKPKTHKIYFDYGNKTLDSLYPPLQKKVDEVMISKGFTSNNWITKFFAGEDHSEKAWNKRLNIPLLFLLKK